MNEFTVLSWVWQLHHTFPDLLSLAPFTLSQLTTCITATEHAPLAHELHHALMQYLLRQHQTDAWNNKLAKELNAVTWTSTCEAYVRHVYSRQCDRLYWDTSTPGSPMQVDTPSPQDLKSEWQMIIRTVQLLPSWSVLVSKNGVALSGVDSLVSAEKWAELILYIDKALDEFVGDADEDIVTAANEVREIFHSLIELLPKEEPLVAITPKRRPTAVPESTSKKRKEDPDVFIDLPDAELQSLLSIFSKLTDNTAYPSLELTSKLTVLEFLCTAVVNSPQFRQEIKQNATQLDKFNDQFGQALQKHATETEELLNRKAQERIEVAQGDLELKKEWRADAKVAFDSGRETSGLVGRAFRRRLPGGWLMDGYVESQSGKDQYRCVYFDGSKEVLSATLLSSNVLPSLNELLHNTPHVNFFNSYTPQATTIQLTPNKPIKKSSKSRRSNRKRKNVVTYAENTPITQHNNTAQQNGNSSQFPFLFLTIAVEGWSLKVNDVVDSVFGFGVVKKVSGDMCELSMGWGVLSCKQDILSQVATLDEIDAINTILLNKARQQDLHQHKEENKARQLEVDAQLQNQVYLQSRVRQPPILHSFGEYIWQIENSVAYENATEIERYTRETEFDVVLEHYNRLSMTSPNDTAPLDIKPNNKAPKSPWQPTPQQTTIPRILLSLPGLTASNRYNPLYALVTTLLRVEANASCLCTQQYRTQGRKSFLHKLKSCKSVKVIAALLVELESQVILGLGIEQGVLEEWAVAVEKNYDVRIFPEAPKEVDVESFLKLNKFAAGSQHEQFLTGCLNGFFKYKEIAVTKEQVESIVCWTRDNGLPALDEKLSARYNSCLESLFEYENVFFVANRKQGIAKDKWQVSRHITTTSDSLIQFLRLWLPVRTFWQNTLATCDALPTVLNLTLCLEQNLSILYSTLTQEDALQLFNDKYLLPHDCQRYAVGDRVIYDHVRHQYALKLEQKLHDTEDGVYGDEDKIYNGGVVWLGDEPRVNEKGGRTTEWTIYLTQFFPNAGEPFCVLTLGPEPLPPPSALPPLSPRPNIVFGRHRTNIPCKTANCRLCSIEGNFGYCEKHRRVEPKGKVLFCYLCYLKEEEDEPCAVCSVCGKMYHQNCLGIKDVGEEWSCPLHKSTGLSESLLRVLDKVCDMSLAEPFLHPVRDEPGYYDVVQKGMCLQEIKRKAVLNEYETPSEALVDVELIVNNCHLWCCSRFPSLPPLADKLKSTIYQLSNKQGIIQNTINKSRKRKRSSIQSKLKPNDTNHNNNSATEQRHGAGSKGGKENDSVVLCLESIVNVIACSAGESEFVERVGKRERKQRSLINEDSFDTRRSGRNKNKPDDEEEKEFTPCGRCNNCIARMTYPNLIDIDELRCTTDQNRASRTNRPIYELSTPPFLRLDSISRKIWEKPNGYGIRCKNTHTCFVVAFPLRHTCPPFVLSKDGWKKIAKYEGVMRDKVLKKL